MNDFCILKNNSLKVERVKMEIFYLREGLMMFFLVGEKVKGI